MPSQPLGRITIVRYGIGILCPLLALGLRLLLTPILHEQAPLQLFLLATVVAAWLGGFGPGVLCAFGGVLLAWGVFIPPDGFGIPPSDQIPRLITFLLTGVAISAIGESMQRALNRERSHREEVRSALDKLADRDRSATLRAEISETLSSEELTLGLQLSAQSLVRHIGAAFARFWTLGEEEDVLKLQASAGLYTHLDGPHSRVKVGEFKIGRIAQNRKPHLTNDVQNDPNVSDRDWAKREGMVAFAGYPLIVEDNVVGVMALFARKPLSEGLLEDLSPLADTIAQFILRKRTEETARALAAIVESSEDAIISKDMDGIVTSWNRGAERLFGFTAAEMIGRSITTQVPTERQQEVTEILEKICAGESIEHLETLRRCKDGRLLEVAVSVSPIRNASGKIIGASKIAHDITEPKRAEAALRASERQLRLVADHAPVLLVQLDREYRYKFVNQPYAARFGRTPQSMLGLQLWEVVGQEAYEIARPYIEQAYAGQQVEFEIAVPYADLGSCWIHASYVPEFDENGGVVGCVAAASDVTQRKQVELELEQARDAALAASRAKDNFLSALSHELRTPLNPVLLLASDAAHNPELSPEIRADFHVVYKNVSLEARLIDDLLDLTRITHGKVKLNPTVLEGHKLLREALEIVQAEIAEKQLHLVLELAASRSVLKGDLVRLQQVFWNLLKNAVKFTPPHGTITLRTFNAADDALVIEISDTGHGLSPEEMGRIFTTFSQGEHADKGNPHRFGGLGLGLALCKLLVELHAGRIQATSAGRDQGACFSVNLPCTAEPLPTGSVANGPGVPTPALSKRVLLIEDHDMTRDMLSRLLTRHGHEVGCAASGASARQAAREREFDVVISDLGLPDCDGHLLMMELRGAYGLSGIALSGYGMERDIQRSLESGFFLHLTKPVEMEVLLQALAEVPPPQR